MPETSLADKLKNWKGLVEAMRPRLADELSHLTQEHALLEAVVKEIEALDRQEDLHTSRLRDSTHKRQELERRGVEAKGRIQAGLQARYGKRSDLLHEFGLKPLATPTRVKKEPQPEPPKASST